MKNVITLSILLLSFTRIYVYGKFTVFLIFLFYVIVYSIQKNRLKITLEWLFLFLYMTFIFLLNLHTSRIISLLYSFAFIFFYSFINGNREEFDYKDFIRLLEIIIVFFFANVFISHVFVLAGIGENFLSIFGRVYEAHRGAFRYFGFTTEPSYAAIIIITSYYAYFIMHRSYDLKRRRIIDISFIYQIFLFNSIYGYILLIIFMYFSSAGKWKLYFISITMLAGIIGSALGILNIYSDYRMSRIISYVITYGFNMDFIRETDSSAFMRIQPTIDYLYNMNLFNWRTYFGHGTAASDAYFTEWFILNLHFTARSQFVADRIGLGFLPAFLYDYGFIATIYTLIIVFKNSVMKRALTFEIIVILLMMTNANFNTQLFCFVITILMMLKYYSNSPFMTEGKEDENFR